MTYSYSESIEEIVQLTEEIDKLAENNDWLSMHDLVERRMLCLNKVFDVINQGGGSELANSDCEKLAEVAESNKRILSQAQARQGEIVSFAGLQRTGSTAQKAYAANAR